MSEPWDQLNFEQLLNDDSLMFEADDTFFPDFVDLEAHYPPVLQDVMQDDQSQGWADLANGDTLPSPVSQYIRRDEPPLNAWPIAQCPPSASLCSVVDHSVRASAHCMQPVECSPSASSQGMRSPSLERPKKAKAHRCTEPGCGARYVRKGDLSRHTRENHSDIEYLCPWAGCFWHRKGHGFKRMHRLVGHLWKPVALVHPCVRSRQDAKYVAVDYNDSLSPIGQMSFALSNEQKPEREVSAIIDPGQDIGPMSKYTDRLLGVWCREVGCSTFVCISFDWGFTENLERHLRASHKLMWEDAEEVAKEVVHSRWSEKELERFKPKKAT